MGSQTAGHSARTCPQPGCVRPGAAQAPQPADPAEGGRGPGPRAPAAHCATLGKSPNLSGPRLSRSLVKARRGRAAEIPPARRPGQSRSPPAAGALEPVPQQTAAAALDARPPAAASPRPPPPSAAAARPASRHATPTAGAAPRTPRRLPGRGLDEKPVGRKASREM